MAVRSSKLWEIILLIGGSGFISGAVAFAVSFHQMSIAERNYALELEQAKIAILELVKEREIELAQATIDYYSDKYSDDRPYKVLLTAISNYLASTNNKIIDEKTIATQGDGSKNPAAEITVATIKSQLGSANRRAYAEFIAATANASSPAQRSQIASNLIDAIMAKDDANGTRYRINLYIALTFSLLPRIDMTADQEQKLLALRRTPDFENSTFRQNLQRALAAQDIAT